MNTKTDINDVFLAYASIYQDYKQTAREMETGQLEECIVRGLDIFNDLAKLTKTESAALIQIAVKFSVCLNEKSRRVGCEMLK